MLLYIFGSGASTPTKHSPAGPQRSESSESGRTPFRGLLDPPAALISQGDRSSTDAGGIGAVDVINAINPL